MPLEVQLQDSACRGATDERGRHYAADGRNVVTLPRRTAEKLMAGGIARRSARLFGGIDLPRRATGMPAPITGEDEGEGGAGDTTESAGPATRPEEINN